MMNIFKTTVLLTALTLLLIFVGGLLGGSGGMQAAFFFALVMNFCAYWFSDKIVLAMYGAKPLSESEAPQIYRIVRELVQEAKIQMPQLYRIPISTPNAFATGRNPEHAVVAVTDGILSLLDDEEMKGVLGHELAHVQHGDILISSVAATLAGAISMLASMARWSFVVRDNRDERGGNPIGVFVAALVAPIAAMLIQLAVSRSREFHADEGGAQICKNPRALASALRKLEAGVKNRPMFDTHASSAHLFIVNPLRASAIASLFSSHPPIEERIARLERMG